MEFLRRRVCPVCGREFYKAEDYYNHLIEEHPVTATVILGDKYEYVHAAGFVNGMGFAFGLFAIPIGGYLHEPVITGVGLILLGLSVLNSWLGIAVSRRYKERLVKLARRFMGEDVDEGGN